MRGVDGIGYSDTDHQRDPEIICRRKEKRFESASRRSPVFPVQSAGKIKGRGEGSREMKERDYRCRGCGAKLSARKIMMKGVTNCPFCGQSLKLKKGRFGIPKLKLDCMCGASYEIDRPNGDFMYECARCGRLLLQVRKIALDLQDTVLPKFVDSGAGGDR